MHRMRPSRSPSGWKGWAFPASVFRYPLNARHPVPLEALRREIRRRREDGADRIGIVGFSAGGHLAGLAALPLRALIRASRSSSCHGLRDHVHGDRTYRPARIILLGEHATPQLRRETSLDALVTPSAPPFFIWHTAEDIYVPPEHTYRFARALAANQGCAHRARVHARAAQPRARPWRRRR